MKARSIFQILCLLAFTYSGESCYSVNDICHNLYFPDCCPRLYISSDKDPSNYGYFCNMQDAVNGSDYGYPFEVGCCQRCWSDNEGCAEAPCCPGYEPAANASCPSGNICVRDSKKSPTKIMPPSCFTENMYCDRQFKCCENLKCDIPEGQEIGKCKRADGYTGPLPDPPQTYNFSLIPLIPGCYGYVPPAETTTPPLVETTAPPTEETTTPPTGETTAPPTGETTAPPTGETTAPPTGETSTTPAGGTKSPICEESSTIGNQNGCKPLGEYCYDQECCDDLQCPNNWYPLWFLRLILNVFGVWYKVCRDYEPLVWYNPFSWYDY